MLITPFMYVNSPKVRMIMVQLISNAPFGAPPVRSFLREAMPIHDSGGGGSSVAWPGWSRGLDTKAAERAWRSWENGHSYRVFP